MKLTQHHRVRQALILPLQDVKVIKAAGHRWQGCEENKIRRVEEKFYK